MMEIPFWLPTDQRFSRLPAVRYEFGPRWLMASIASWLA
jgi:hypothetical protein